MTGTLDERDRSMPIEHKELLAETAWVRAARFYPAGAPVRGARELHRRGERAAEEFHRELKPERGTT